MRAVAVSLISGSGLRADCVSSLFVFLLVPDNFTIITDSTSYFITLPLNEVTDQGDVVTLQEFTIFFSSSILNGIYLPNVFIFLLQSVGGGGLSSFVLQTTAYQLPVTDTIETRSNALQISAGSSLDIGVYNLTLQANPFDSTPFPIVNFTVNIVEGKFKF